MPKSHVFKKYFFAGFSCLKSKKTSKNIFTKKIKASKKKIKASKKKKKIKASKKKQKKIKASFLRKIF